MRIHNDTEPMLDGLLREVRDDRRPALGRIRLPPPPPASRTEPHPPPLGGRRYSVEMLGSAWTLCGTTIRKFSGALAASSRIRSASSSWSVACSSSA